MSISGPLVTISASMLWGKCLFVILLLQIILSTQFKWNPELQAFFASMEERTPDHLYKEVDQYHIYEK